MYFNTNQITGCYGFNTLLTSVPSFEKQSQIYNYCFDVYFSHVINEFDEFFLKNEKENRILNSQLTYKNGCNLRLVEHYKNV